MGEAIVATVLASVAIVWFFWPFVACIYVTAMGMKDSKYHNDAENKRILK